MNLKTVHPPPYELNSPMFKIEIRNAQRSVREIESKLSNATEIYIGFEPLLNQNYYSGTSRCT